MYFSQRVNPQERSRVFLTAAWERHPGLCACVRPAAPLRVPTQLLNKAASLPPGLLENFLKVEKLYPCESSCLVELEIETLP